MTTQTDFKEIVITPTNGAPRYRFSGSLLAKVSSERPTSRQWTELEAYKTETGKWVIATIGEVRDPDENMTRRLSALIFDDDASMTAKIGHGRLAAQLYRNLGIEEVVIGPITNITRKPPKTAPSKAAPKERMLEKDDMTVAEYLEAAIEMSGKTQAQVAKEAGFNKPNVISMMKKGLTKVPIYSIPDLAKACGQDPARFVSLAMSEYNPKVWNVLRETFGEVLSEDERDVLEAYRANLG